MTTDISTLGIACDSRDVVTASDRLNKLESQAGKTEQASSKLGSAFDKLGYSTQSLIKYIEAAAAALALMELAKKASEAALLAARYETLGVVVNVVGKTAGYTASQMAEFQAGLQKTGISAVEARQGLALMGQAQIDFSNSTKLARIAQDAAVIGNINSSEAFNRMMTGLATGQSILLHHLGLMTNFESAYKKAADAAGKNTNQLTESEKVQIRVNEVIRAGVGIQGAYEAAMGTVGKQLTSLPRYVSDLMVQVGEMGQGPLFDAVSGLTATLKYLTKNFEEVKSVAEAFAGIGLTVLFARITDTVGTAIIAENNYMRSVAAGNVVTLGSAQAVAQKAAAHAVETANVAASTAAQEAYWKAELASATAIKEKLVVEAQALPVGVSRASNAQRIAVANMEVRATEIMLAEATAASTAAQAANITATTALTVAQGEATIAGRVLTGIQGGLQAAMTLVGGELGLIVIAVAAATYAWDKYSHAQEDAQRKISQFDASSVVGQLAQQNRELEKSVKLMTQTSAQKAAESESQFQVTINNLKKEEIELSQKLTAAKSNNNVFAAQQTASETKELEAKLFLVKRDLEYAPKLYAENQKLLAQQTAAREARKVTEPVSSEESNSEISHYNRYAEAYNRMVDAIAEGAPTLTAEEKAVQKLKDQYEKLFIDFPEHVAELKALEQAHMQQVLSLQAMQQAIKDTSTEFQALFSQWENTTPEHSVAGEFGIVNEEILKLVDSLSGQDKLDEFNDNLRKMEGALSEAAASAPDKVEAITRALQLLKDSYADSSGLTRLQSDNKSTEIGLIQNQFDQKQALIEQEYQAKKDAYEKELALATTSAEKREALERALFLNKQKYDQASADNAKNSINSQLSMYAAYAQGAATLLTSLADAQDQSSRKGFETAKAFNLAAAVMSTAAGIMNQYSSGDPYTANFRALIVAATGVVQIAKIASTTFKGGSASVTAPAGSFNAGSSQSSLGSNSGIGSQIGTQYSSVYDQQSQESLQKLADSADNASLAIGKVADGLTDIASLFDDEDSYLSLATGALPSSKLAKPDTIVDTIKAVIKDTSLTLLNPLKSITDLFSGKLFSSIGGIVSSIGSALFGGKWYTKSAGIALSMSGDDVDVDDYLYKKKSGGLFVSSKKKYVYSDDDVWTGIIQTTIDSIASTINHAAVAMGTTSNFSAASLGLTRIQTTGRTEEDIAKDLQTWLESASNSLAKTVVGLKEYTFYNENAYDALVRLSTALQDTNEKFELIGATLLSSTLASANSAYKLQQLFGGTEAFDKAINTYFTAMFTDSEQYGMKAAQAVRQVNTAFGEMDISVPATRAEFTKLVNSLDTSTESGAALFQALMNISTAFGTVQDQIDAQTSQTQDLTTRLLTAMGYSTESDLYALKIQQQKELTEATQKGLDVTALAIVQQVEYAAALMKPIKTMSTALHDMIDSAVTYTTKQAFSIVSAALTSGNLSDTTQLTAAAKVLNGLSSDGYSTALDYQRGQALANVMITNLAAMADNQISDAEKTYMVSVSQLNALTDITTEIQGLRNEVRAVATATGKALTIFDKWDGDGMPAVAAG